LSAGSFCGEKCTRISDLNRSVAAVVFLTLKKAATTRKYYKINKGKNVNIEPLDELLPQYGHSLITILGVMNWLLGCLVI
jgi:hypothetical protein